MRFRTFSILLLPAFLGQAPADAPKTVQVAKSRREVMHDIYLADASSYTIYRDAGRKEKAELRREPAYSWTNPTKNSGQDGDVFVWTYRGRPEAVGTIFSSPAPEGGRYLIHEMHSLARTVLDVERTGQHGWKPLQPGIDLKPIPDAPAPAKSATQRLAQMRALIREFSSTATDYQGVRWELRVLPQPLYRYESTDPDVLDGAVFTLVSTAGTDPEQMIVIEARKGPGETGASWQFGAARFSDQALSVKHKDKVVYQVPLIPYGTPVPDPTHRYHLANDRTIPPVEETSSKADADATANPPEPKRKP